MVSLGDRALLTTCSLLAFWVQDPAFLRALYPFLLGRHAVLLRGRAAEPGGALQVEMLEILFPVGLWLEGC